MLHQLGMVSSLDNFQGRRDLSPLTFYRPPWTNTGVTLGAAVFRAAELLCDVERSAASSGEFPEELSEFHHEQLDTCAPPSSTAYLLAKAYLDTRQYSMISFYGGDQVCAFVTTYGLFLVRVLPSCECIESCTLLQSLGMYLHTF